MALDAGTLRVTLHYAKDLKDCDWFGKQDPYVRLRIGTQERRSRVCRDGGRNPVWDETFEFSVINENTLELTLMDEDKLSRDDLIGTCTVSLARAREHGTDVVQAPVSSGKKVAKQKGFVQVTLVFSSNSKLRPQSAPFPSQPPPPVYGYGYPAPQAPQPMGYGYPPPGVAPPPYGYTPAPSYHYSPSFAPPAPPPQAPAWPAQPPPYGPPPPAPSGYYPPPPSAPPQGYAPYPQYGAPAPYR